MTLTDFVTLFPTPAAVSYGTNKGGAAGRIGKERLSLESMARRDMWPTPTTRDWKSSASNLHGQNSRPLNEVIRLTEGGGQLNPTWVEGLMNYSAGWTRVEPWALFKKGK